jgi:hypothetical protein
MVVLDCDPPTAGIVCALVMWVEVHEPPLIRGLHIVLVACMSAAA